jgi:UDP-N-acetylglucosamine 2-epimerase (non-hydrolysing)
MKIISVVGARPNFMKIAPFIHAINQFNAGNAEKIDHLLVHTGQHYDERMVGAFFRELRIPEPDINLGIGSGTHAEQVGLTMIAFEKVLLDEKPDWVVVPGDVNATLACSLAAKKLHIRVCHIEAGLRSFDNNMPEEINRIVTDRIADLLLTPDHFAGSNLQKEGMDSRHICFVGNIMIDTLRSQFEEAMKCDIQSVAASSLISGNHALSEGGYALLTLHRPSNVDTPEVLADLVKYITTELSRVMPVLWTVHPRAEKNLRAFGLWDMLLTAPAIVLLHPLEYRQMLRLNAGARIVITDSGGLQEECTVLGKPCAILRDNTERPATLIENGGAGMLSGSGTRHIRETIQALLERKTLPFTPEYWDGNTAGRCLEAILNYI